MQIYYKVYAVDCKVEYRGILICNINNLKYMQIYSENSKTS